jgi:mono/diheme cytochrome c family protein
MKPLFRPALPTSRRAAPLARPALGALMMLSAFGASAQQWTAGQGIWQTGKPGQPGLGFCAQCHSTSALAVFRTRFTTVDAARNAAQTFSNTPGGGGMAVLFNALSPAEKDQVAAYVADIRAEGNVSANPGGALSVTAVGQSASTVVTLFNNGRAPMTVLANNGVRLTGTGAAQFTVTGIGTGCLAQTLAANGGSCQVRVTYQPSVAPSSTHAATLTFEHNGEPQTTTTLAVSGSIAAAPAPAPTPAPAPAPASDGGGGALPLTLWATLLPAALVARRRRD